LRHTVRPGITGLAQVNGRNKVKWDDRLEMDIKYVEDISFKMDISIILSTIKSVVNRKDIVVIPSQLFNRLDVERKNGIKS
jgi:lipopolysaccharide/colanic/teichoic acid biosynthesis glycosyltransferase